MSVVALSPVATEPPSHMITSVTPTTNHGPLPSGSVKEQLQDQALSPGHSSEPYPSWSPLPGGQGGPQPPCRHRRAPPLHTGADWKVVLHLPEIETWLRATAERVTQLTHSVSQDTHHRHVDVHLVQLKDICEDISDHVEQIHALLETEFSLKLLSYSVNIIVDIRTVQVLWHQLRVSVLVLKERLLQGLQDSNGNFTRKTDILQAFSQEQQQTRLDALTEVDDCGQLTIRCSQDYFSLDCGITAYELSDYSPGEPPETQEEDPDLQDPQIPDPNLKEIQDPSSQYLQEPNIQDPQLPQDPEEPQREEIQRRSEPKQPVKKGAEQRDPEAAHTDSSNSADSLPPAPTMHRGASNPCEALMSKRPLPVGGVGGALSPTQPSLPKRVALLADGRAGVARTGRALGKPSPPPRYRFQVEMSPSPVDPVERSKFWLELDSQSTENLQVVNGCDRQTTAQSLEVDGEAEWGTRGPHTPQSGSSWVRHSLSGGKSDSPLPSPRGEAFLTSFDMETSREDLDGPATPAELLVKGPRQQTKVHWFGSEEFLALPDHLRQTELLAINLESLAQTLPLMSSGCELNQEGLQDIDDWDLTELNPEWDMGESSDDTPPAGESSDDAPFMEHQQSRHYRFRVSPSSSSDIAPSSSSDIAPSSSSDIAPSLDESIESGPLSDLRLEADEGRSTRTTDSSLEAQSTSPLLDAWGTTSLVSQLLEGIQRQESNPNIWKKIEGFVLRLDVFIAWLKDALLSTDNWTQPKQELDSLRLYLDTHLSFKMNVDSRSVLKESIMEEGRLLLTLLTSHNSGLRDILQMVSGQWDQLQRQIRRQHSWMLEALRTLLRQSHGPLLAFQGTVSNQQRPCPTDCPKVELTDRQQTQREALEQMAASLSNLYYTTTSTRRRHSQPARSTSLQEFEANYQELWDWLMDMEAMVTDSHQLMMSEVQKDHLYKGLQGDVSQMRIRMSSLLGLTESLKRSPVRLPQDFQHKMHTLTQRWKLLEKMISEHSGVSTSHPPQGHQSGLASLEPLGFMGGDSGRAAEPSSLCPLSRTLLDQLEVRIKELKSWLRDTELLIFHSCLRTDQSASVQLPSFKSLCEEVRGRRRAVSSVLRLCQKLLQQSQMGPLAELGPDAEQHREALQLLSINLERRWEAIVMQSLQWQNRLKKELEEEQVLGNDLELDLADLNQTSLVPPALVGPEDSWEWDEMDMTITGAELQDITGHNILTTAHPDMFQSDGTQSGSMAPHGLESYENLPIGTCSASSDLTFQSERPIAMPLATPPNNNRIYQVYSLHNIELSGQHLWSLPHRSQTLSPSKTNTGNRKHQPPLKSHSKDSSFSSYESLPDLLGGGPLSVGGGERGESTVGYMDGGRGGRGSGGRSSGGRSSGGRSSGGRTSGGRSSGSGESESSRHSESESGIASDTETTANSEIQGDNDEDEEEERRTLRIGEKEGGTWDGQEAEEASADAAGRTGTHTSQGRREVGVVGGRGREESKSESRKRSDCREGQSKWKRTERAGEGRRLRDKMNVEKRRGQRKSEEEEAKMSAGRACLLVPPPPGSNLEAMETTQEPTKPFSRQDDVTGLKAFHAGGLEALLGPAGLSRGSSLESLLALGLELFPSPKDPLQRSASLESCLASCLSGGGTSSVSLASLGESGPTEAGVPGNDPGMSQGDVSSGELSRRTLDLLKRLEKIQSPPAVKMTRSVSDMVMHSSPQFRGLRTSPLLWGPHALLPGAMVTGGSATTSLTELSGAEDSSLGSEDCNALKSRLFLDPGAPDNGNFCSFRRRCHGNGRRGQGGEEADAASLSMVVNVSCTSEDEDDSDLLSSSTLTLTEEELGVREEEEETSSIASSGDEEAEIEEEEMEGCEYIRKELHNWNRPPRLSFSSSRGEASLQDELQCGSSASSASSASSNPHNSCTLSSSPLPGSLVAHNAAESGITNGNNKARSEQEEKEQKEEDLENRRNATRSYIRRLVDDVENGNVEHSRLTGREEDDQLLLEEAGLFMKKAEAFRFQSCIFATTGDGLSNAGHMTGDCESSITKTDPLSSPTCELLRFSSKQTSSLVGQLRGELPCQSPPRPSPPSLSPTDDSMSHDALQSNVPAARGRKSITIQESFAFSSLVTEESRRQVRDKESSFAPKRRRHVLPSCCLAHLPPRRPSSSPEQKRENVHDFVMEIIDMTSHALRGKGNQTQTQDQDQTQDQVQGQLYEGTTDPITASLAHIREKVLEHSHQPLQLRKGDFYSYLSLSSHDSDCGEVSLFSEEKSSTPAPYSIPCYATPMPSLRGPSPAPPASPAPATHAHTQNSLLIRPEKATSACDPATDGGRSGQPSNSLHRAHQASSSSPSPDIRDEETLFSACTEEVYLGPPLCYSMEFTQETRGSSVELTEETRGSSVELTQETRGSSPRLSQGPGYLSSQGPRSRLLHAVPRASPPQTCSVVKEDPARLPQGGSGPQSSEARGHLSPPKECIPRRLQCGGGALCEVGESLHGVSPSPGNHSKTPPSSVRSSSGRRPPSSSGELGLLPMAPVPGGSRGESWGESSGNEEAAYLNPSPRVTAIGRSSAHCTTDSEALESNMGAVMTKISVCSSTTNPSEEAAVSGTRINPQMKCSMMREGDTEGEERGGRLQSGRGREEDWMGRTGSQQEAKETAGNQIIKSTHSGVSHVTRTSQSTSSSMTVKTPPGGGVRGQRSRSRGGLSSAALQPADVMPHLDPALTQTPRRDHVHTPGAPCSIAAVVVFPPIEPGPGEGVGSGLCCRAASF